MTGATASARLIAKLDLGYPAVAAYAERIWLSPDVRSLYPKYLTTMHAIVRSAVPLMAAALARAHELAETDRVAAGLIDYLTRHAKEESGHDAWLLEDLAAIGFDPGEAEHQFPSARVAALVGAQYYWIRHYHPLALLGHIAALETYHPPRGFANRLAALTGYPKAAFRTVARHEALDIRHKRDLCKILDTLPLEGRHERVLAISGFHTFEGAIEVLDELFESGRTRKSSPGGGRVRRSATPQEELANRRDGRRSMEEARNG